MGARVYNRVYNATTHRCHTPSGLGVLPPSWGAPGPGRMPLAGICGVAAGLLPGMSAGGGGGASMGTGVERAACAEEGRPFSLSAQQRGE